MDYTENYQLSLWDMTDAVKMDDFNSDHEKIDAAIKDAAEQVYFGNWTGDGSKNRTITLPFAPKLLLIFGHYCSTGESPTGLITIATQEKAYYTSTSGCSFASKDFGGILSGSTFQLGQYAQYHNAKGQTVHYLALK